MQLISSKKFAIIVIDWDKQGFIMYMAYLKATISIYPTWETTITLLIAQKVIIPAKYLDLKIFF